MGVGGQRRSFLEDTALDHDAGLQLSPELATGVLDVAPAHAVQLMTLMMAW